MDRRPDQPRYLLRRTLLVLALVVCGVASGLAYVGEPPRSLREGLEVVALGALSVAGVAEGWWRWRRHFPIFPQRPGD